MAVSSASTDPAFKSLMKLGHLRPWEVADANAAARDLKPAALRRLMSRIADQVSASLNEPLTPPDVDLVLSTASNIGGIFAEVKNAKDIAHSLREDARGWRLVLSALDGQSYDAILTAIRSDASREAGRTADASQLIGSVHGALKEGLRTGTADSVEARLEPAVPIRKSILPDYLICLEDGRKFKSLTRHLRTKYNMSPSDYRAKWGLPNEYPMLAPEYSAARSALAKETGSGRGKAVAGGRRKVATK